MMTDGDSSRHFSTECVEKETCRAVSCRAGGSSFGSVQCRVAQEAPHFDRHGYGIGSA